MPELPEVETTRLGIAPNLEGRSVTGVRVRQPRLRYPIPEDLAERLCGQTILAVKRRAKYLLLEFSHGSLLLHLGMSGSLRIVPADTPPVAHEHFDLVCNNTALRLRDPRRFGAVLWLEPPANRHPLLARLGIEPLEEGFDGPALHALCKGKRTPIKQLLMDGHLIVGIGNIYASESLFRARIHPATPAGRLTLARCTRLTSEIRQTLRDALAAGGSSLRDFVHSDGSSGYFQQQYFVYGRDNEPCRHCGSTVRRLIQGQRASFYCPRCQRTPPGT
ncbi:MAG: DNA-formamidopyrimidine glycosylase [Candidatus Dactylopiibacterium carminicum]|uniref:Formamidopyrimidine-DNA glycosylase n=1 Tax=Candidatus Dactylopiibacterium carminicum TaxID=857335 RepID=A0A272EQ31_9RHOO|nr:bifunctional DNA-formamidopyrimidine glycosylase/DNA-(apurinic or apyrimidinic site) lyase [Candidatus Dactylopiibacterium carminicum]KAF7598451.1 bifunctional DNA-formamidopyrimidine glycosylase/DNA-(apurinic or apyrimidinic site) lyase [Candidatus Dactylopiibacterium carminicum]PAS92219.1 MAG: DNA-formamidopyrimidine glycosylase [Candidatus Dactylopiibacterium carminicum]PAS97770.1 MAG: DNA-formamidopyrimidine glycosylase [Candidatus Dactylopiibacterium carminicum]